MRDRLVQPGRGGWTAIAAILAVFLALVWMRNPVERFGGYHDDALYASAARSIADGAGYRQASLPGSPPATKYPPGFPYVLAAAMQIVPGSYADPAKLWIVSAAAACWALLVTFVYLSGWKEVSWGLAAVAAALAASQETFLLLSGSLLSDAVFMALAITALYLADREQPTKRDLAAAALLTGLAVLTRSAGAAVAAGIVACFLWRRRFRAAAGFALGVAPFVAIGALSKLAASAPPARSAGLRQTWLYYSDYAGFWRASVPDMETLTAMLYENIGSLLEAPAALSLGAPPPGQLGMIAWATLSVAIVSGLVRQARSDRVRPIHMAALFSLLPAALWNFEIGDRLLLPFAPLFAMGLCIEVKRMAPRFWRAAQPGNPAGERAVSAVFLAVIAVIAVFLVNRSVRAQIAAATQQPRGFDALYSELFVWMRENTSPDARFVGIDDGLFYLRTGRQGMWPLALTTEPRFRPDKARLNAQLDLLPDVAREIGARYVIQADHDYAYSPIARERWLAWTEDLPVVARNADGSARILDLGCRTDCDDEPSAGLAARSEP